MREQFTEKQFQAHIIALAHLLGWLVYHTYRSDKSAGGFPDLLLLRGGVQVVAELKVGDRQVTADQEIWLEAFRTAGVQAFVWRPADWKEIEGVLSS